MLGPAYDLWRLDCPDDDCELTEEEIAEREKDMREIASDEDDYRRECVEERYWNSF